MDFPLIKQQILCPRQISFGTIKSILSYHQENRFVLNCAEMHAKNES